MVQGSRFAHRLRRAGKIAAALFHLGFGLVLMAFSPKNIAPVYKGLRYFLELEAYKRTMAVLLGDPETRALVETRYREGEPLRWEELRALAPDTLGARYFQLMCGAGVTPIEQLPEHETQISPEVDYLRRRIRVAHDIHHVLTGHEVDELGEMGISAFYIGQIWSPLNAFVLALGLVRTTLRRPAELHALMDAIVEGYAMGREAKLVFGLKYEEEWATPVDELRARYGITPTAG